MNAHHWFVRARVALILALAATTTMLAPSRAYAAPERAVVSLGDSYSSGEGNPPFYGSKKSVGRDLEDYRAHRSTTSWPGQLVLDGTTLSTSRGSGSEDGKWYFYASSGAVAYHIYAGTQEKGGDPNAVRIQLQAAKDELGITETDKGDVAYVTMTIGGNDMGFADIVTKVAACPGFVDRWYLQDSINRAWWDYDKTLHYPSLLGKKKSFESNESTELKKDQILKAYRYTRATFGPNTKIIVAGYPTLMNDYQRGGWLTRMANLLANKHNPLARLFTVDEATLINNNVCEFNRCLKGLVKEASNDADSKEIYFVSVEERFAGHEAYTASPYLNGIKLLDVSPKISADIGYSFHPNAAGMEQYRAAVQEKIDQLEGAEQVAKDERIVLAPDAAVSVTRSDGSPHEGFRITLRPSMVANVGQEFSMEVEGSSVSLEEVFASGRAGILETGGTGLESYWLVIEDLADSGRSQTLDVTIVKGGDATLEVNLGTEAADELPDASGTPQGTAATKDDAYAAYAAKLKEYLDEYGYPALDNPTQISSRIKGITLAKLLDFDGDGLEELIVGYQAEGLGYRFEVWQYKDGLVSTVYQGPVTSQGTIVDSMFLRVCSGKSISTGSEMSAFEAYDLGSLAQESGWSSHSLNTISGGEAREGVSYQWESDTYRLLIDGVESVPPDPLDANIYADLFGFLFDDYSCSSFYFYEYGASGDSDEARQYTDDGGHVHTSYGPAACIALTKETMRSLGISSDGTDEQPSAQPEEEAPSHVGYYYLNSNGEPVDGLDVQPHVSVRIYSDDHGTIEFQVYKIGPNASYIYETNLITATLQDGSAEFSWSDSWLNSGMGTIGFDGESVRLFMEATDIAEANRTSMSTASPFIVIPKYDNDPECPTPQR